MDIKEQCVALNILKCPKIIFENICLYLTMSEIINYISTHKQDVEHLLKNTINGNTVFRHVFKQIYQNEPIFENIKHHVDIPKCVYQNFHDHLLHWETSLQYVNWLNEDEKSLLCLQFANKAEQIHTMYQFSWYHYFNKSKVFNILCRILPFKSSFKINLENVYNIDLTHRDLYSMEKNLFKCIQITNYNFIMIAQDVTQTINEDSMHYNRFNVVNYQTFQNNLNSMFHYSQWKDFINWNYFVMIGRAISSALLNVNIAEQKDEICIINICSYKISHEKFTQEILKINEQLMKVKPFEENNYIFTNIDKYNKLFTLTIGNTDIQYIKLYFSYCCSFNNLSHLLDVTTDIFQLVFIPQTNKLLGTPMFFQCIRSGYIIPYGVMLNEKYVNYEIITIIQDLVHKDFNYFLLPKKASMEVLQQTLCNEFSVNHIICYQQVDLYNIQETFIRKYINQCLH